MNKCMTCGKEGDKVAFEHKGKTYYRCKACNNNHVKAEMYRSMAGDGTAWY